MTDDTVDDALLVRAQAIAERTRADAAEAQRDRLAAALRWDWDGFESWAHADEAQVYQGNGNEPDRAWYQHAYWKLKEKGLKAIEQARAALADVREVKDA